MLLVSEGHQPAPLLVMLHGASGTGRRAATMILPQARERGCMVLAPDSRGTTWDAITGDFGPDVRFLERALGETLGHRAVDRTRVAVAGFSDGASYALALGRANGDLFTHLIAFSPGFLIPVRRVGGPRCFVSHGIQDRVLPIDRCSRRMVPQLLAAATLCGTGSSRAATRSRRGWQGRRSTGSSEPRSEPAARALTPLSNSRSIFAAPPPTTRLSPFLECTIRSATDAHSTW